VRIERAIDAYLDWRQLERDATPRSLDSYRRILRKLAEAYPEAPIGDLTTTDLRAFVAEHWRDRSAATRSNVISVLHSFFGWAEAEDLIEVDPSRKIRRPPKRKPDVYRPSLDELKPELDDHVVTVEVEQWVSAYERERRRKDPKVPASDQALMRMVWRICKRAGLRRLSPHQLRHGFANRSLRESGLDVVALQALMGHPRPDTTQQYTDEVELDELAEALDRAAASRHAQASPELETLASDVTAALEAAEWRRRESNPRPRTPRQSVYKLRPRLELRPDRWFATDLLNGLAILSSRAAGDWLSFGASPFVDAACRATGRARGDTLR
jgi:site-specific recombinase XerC